MPTRELAPRAGGTDKDPLEVCEATMAAAVKKGYAALLKDHEVEHAKSFGVVTIPAGPKDREPFDKRLQGVLKGEKDPMFAALYEQYARYLLLRDLKLAERTATRPAK